VALSYVHSGFSFCVVLISLQYVLYPTTSLPSVLILCCPVLSWAILLMTPCQTELGRSIIIRAIENLFFYLFKRQEWYQKQTNEFLVCIIIQLLSKLIHLDIPLFTLARGQHQIDFHFHFKYTKHITFYRMQQLTQFFYFYDQYHFDFMTFTYMQLTTFKSFHKVLVLIKIAISFEPQKPISLLPQLWFDMYKSWCSYLRYAF